VTIRWTSSAGRRASRSTATSEIDSRPPVRKASTSAASAALGNDAE
jgi:hypothetical protein